jgi:hypothetical protein
MRTDPVVVDGPISARYLREQTRGVAWHGVHGSTYLDSARTPPRSDKRSKSQISARFITE